MAFSSLAQLAAFAVACVPCAAVAGSVSAENFAHHNYGNIKASVHPTTYKSYDSPEAGVAAIKNWLIRAQNEHGLYTLSKLIGDEEFGYAPASDNPGKDLISDAVQRTGFKPHQKLNMEDPVQAHVVTAAILAQEGAPQKAFEALAGDKIGGVVAVAKAIPDQDWNVFRDRDEERKQLASADERSEAPKQPDWNVFPDDDIPAVAVPSSAPNSSEGTHDQHQLEEVHE